MQCCGHPGQYHDQRGVGVNALGCVGGDGHLRTIVPGVGFELSWLQEY